MKKVLVFITLLTLFVVPPYAQSSMTNIDARETTSLNGEWQVIIDPAATGDWRKIWLEKEPVHKTDFVEYSFEGGPVLSVPGDFNTQMCELTYYEGIVWYKKEISYTLKPGKRVFVHFGAVNYKAHVYLNGRHIGSHEGGFTPFQFEITDNIKNGSNALIVKVNNQRVKDGLPGLGYDWFNYGGITRDVNLIETNKVYIEEYHIQLKKHSDHEVSGWVQLNGTNHPQQIGVQIPGLGVNYKTESNHQGWAEVHFSAPFTLWSPDNPRLYKVIVHSETDTVVDEIGFRNIEVAGNKVMLNGKPIFLQGVNIHEENPLKAARAFSKSDATMLLTWAKELGCNLVRLAHYPHNKYMVKQAEKMGLMVWNELPVYQHIEFAKPDVPEKMDMMMREMIRRDRNRCNVVIWCLSNETYPSTVNRDNALATLTKNCREMDSTRLITHVTNSQTYENHTFHIRDTLYKYSDIVALNEYVGWYIPWQGKPENTKWDIIYDDKPVFISEFGGEAQYGSSYGPKDEAAYWREEYQAQIFKDQIKMFDNIPNLCGVSPWLLVDYRSPGRMHPIYQKGWNRKGLISDDGKKKKAWYIMQQYYIDNPGF